MLYSLILFYFIFLRSCLYFYFFAYIFLALATKDTSELYPAPYGESTAGNAERIVGDWLKKQPSSFRDKLVLSTNICGWSDDVTWCRGAAGQGTNLSKQQIKTAVESQLQRLGTGHIDLLQFHWPERHLPIFGQPLYRYELERPQEKTVSMEEQLEAVNELIKEGKVRHFGLSNESPYGVARLCDTARSSGLVKPCSVQNVYNLLERVEFDSGMQEALAPANENMGFIAYSPLAGGALTGKYLGDLRRDDLVDARLRRYTGFQARYLTPTALEAVNAYAQMADEFGLPLHVIALAFVYSRKFVSSTLIGASSMTQLHETILALNVANTPTGFSSALVDMVNAVYEKYPAPTRVQSISVTDYNMPPPEDYGMLPWGGGEEDLDPQLGEILKQYQ